MSKNDRKEVSRFCSRPTTKSLVAPRVASLSAANWPERAKTAWRTSPSAPFPANAAGASGCRFASLKRRHRNGLASG